jgi:hypothetical protein
MASLGLALELSVLDWEGPDETCVDLTLFDEG